MKMRPFVAWIPVVAGATGCTVGMPREVSSVGPQTVDPGPPGALVGPYVPSGELLSVRADQSVDTFYSAPGTPFTATVITPLRDPTGRTLVDVGAKVHGRFVSFVSQRKPRVELAIKSVDTVEGRVPLVAAVREAQHVDWVAPARLAPQPQYQFPTDFLEYGPQTPGTAGPPQPTLGYEADQPRQVHIPEGAIIELQLTKPLILPGVHPAQPR